MAKIVCAFTGHRPKSFPWKYDEKARDCVQLKEVLAVQIKQLAEQGVTTWLTGMAQGVDLWATEIVLDLKKKIPLCASAVSFPARGRSANGWHQSRSGIVLFCGRLMR